MLTLDNAKDAEMRFRLPAWLKADFLRHCKRRDVPASQLLRRFVRAVVLQEAHLFEDEVQALKATPYDCPRCGCSEIRNLDDGYGLCTECRLVWKTLPGDSEIYPDRLAPRGVTDATARTAPKVAFRDGGRVTRDRPPPRRARRGRRQPPAAGAAEGRSP